MVIDEALIRTLVGVHLPAAAALPIAALPGGWDNRSFRLGDRLVVRLPSADRYVAGAEKEARALPMLAGRLPLAIPRLVTAVPAGPMIARPWSVLEWIDGRTAADVVGEAQVTLAGELARFLGALHSIDPAGGPRPGPHSFGRGGPLAAYDTEMRAAIARLGVRAGAAAALWEAALARPFTAPPVWLHGDLHPGNLLIRDGLLTAVIDWGLAAVGDPAADLAIAWRWFDADARRAFRAALPMDDGAWVRGAAWAAWRAAIILAQMPGTDQRERRWAAATLDTLAADPPTAG